MAATVVELDRVDRAELRAGQFGDEDVVVAVERFGAAARPVDPQGAADAIDDRGLVDDLRTGDRRQGDAVARLRSEEPTSELQSLMRISYAVFCLKKKKTL